MFCNDTDFTIKTNLVLMKKVTLSLFFNWSEIAGGDTLPRV